VTRKHPGVTMGGTALVAVGARRSRRIVILGGGIGGLAAAVALRQRGFEVRVFERASTIAEVGAGLQVGPNAVKVLYALGLKEALHRSAFEPTNMVSIKWDDASLRHRVPLKAIASKEYGAPYMTAHRAHIQAMLHDALPNGVITLNASCIGAETRRKVAVARFADGREVEGDVVVGADGIRSAIRAQHFGADRPRFTEMMCWRCMVPIEHVPTKFGPNGSVELARGEYFGWLGPNGHVICYPIGKGDMLNLFCGHVTDQWVEESWSVPSTQDELIAAYAGWNEALLSIFRHVEHVFKWGIHDRDPVPEWTRGRVTLLGDAAHPTMPTLAQGGNMAIEDGYVLARNLDRYDDDVEAGLKAYVAERQPRTARVTLQSRQQFANNRKVPPPPFLDRTWIFTFDATREEDVRQMA
jgi:2-polyprenyl-6-methoxyphenol hydroxylase-like FAD-dependent oxidoreductase